MDLAGELDTDHPATGEGEVQTFETLGQPGQTKRVEIRSPTGGARAGCADLLCGPGFPGRLRVEPAQRAVGAVEH
ncbi:hypothetical protein STTU_0961 [Streptomyces sp. Tu6071]|nr:hypothetical protein STTU_0961 [Streptomyces sp. Tu6071]